MQLETNGSKKGGVMVRQAKLGRANRMKRVCLAVSLAFGAVAGETSAGLLCESAWIGDGEDMEWQPTLLNFCPKAFGFNL